MMSAAFPLEWSFWTSLSMGVGAKVVFMGVNMRHPSPSGVQVITAMSAFPSAELQAREALSQALAQPCRSATTVSTGRHWAN